MYDEYEDEYCEHDISYAGFCALCDLESAGTNRDDRVNRVQPQLSCSICPPNRGENSNNDNYKLSVRRPSQKKIAKDRRDGREFKKKNR